MALKKLEMRQGDKWSQQHRVVEDLFNGLRAVCDRY
jgi:hypothetical protein